MRRVFLLALLVGISIAICASDANAEGGKMRLRHFFNFEWLRDADGDGIPNCLDDDWTPPQNGTGYQDTHGFGSADSGAMNGDGQIQEMSRTRNRHGSGNESGAGDLTRSRTRLRDGSCTN